MERLKECENPCVDNMSGQTSGILYLASSPFPAAEEDFSTLFSNLMVGRF